MKVESDRWIFKINACIDFIVNMVKMTLMYQVDEKFIKPQYMYM